jgi:hypothetical protein
MTDNGGKHVIAAIRWVAFFSADSPLFTDPDDVNVFHFFEIIFPAF